MMSISSANNLDLVHLDTEPGCIDALLQWAASTTSVRKHSSSPLSYVKKKWKCCYDQLIGDVTLSRTSNNSPAALKVVTQAHNGASGLDSKYNKCAVLLGYTLDLV